MTFVFFGTPDIAVRSLQALEAAGRMPSLVVTAPDKPKGRGLHLTPSPVRVWADARQIPVLTPAKLDAEALSAIAAVNPELGVVVAYGKILPQTLLDMFPKGIVNLHPSLLPKHRGPSPIESQILNEQDGADVGVSIMVLDAQMDHGPVLAQERNIPAIIASWPMRASALYPLLGDIGGALLAHTIAGWLDGSLTLHEQDHEQATYCAKTKKEDAHIDLSGDAQTNYRKFLAYDIWPRAFFIQEQGTATQRVIITDAALQDGAFVIKRVLPEGRKEMPYDSFLKGMR